MMVDGPVGEGSTEESQALVCIWRPLIDAANPRRYRS